MATYVYRLEYYISKKEDGAIYRLPEPGRVTILAFSRDEAIKTIGDIARGEGYYCEVFGITQLCELDKISAPVVNRIIEDRAPDYFKHKTQKEVMAELEIKKGLSHNIWRNASL